MKRAYEPLVPLGYGMYDLEKGDFFRHKDREMQLYRNPNQVVQGWKYAKAMKAVATVVASHAAYKLKNLNPFGSNPQNDRSKAMARSSYLSANKKFRARYAKKYKKAAKSGQRALAKAGRRATAKNSMRKRIKQVVKGYGKRKRRTGRKPLRSNLLKMLTAAEPWHEEVNNGVLPYVSGVPWKTVENGQIVGGTFESSTAAYAQVGASATIWNSLALNQPVTAVYKSTARRGERISWKQTIEYTFVNRSNIRLHMILYEISSKFDTTTAISATVGWQNACTSEPVYLATNTAGNSADINILGNKPENYMGFMDTFHIHRRSYYIINSGDQLSYKVTAPLRTHNYNYIDTTAQIRRYTKQLMWIAWGEPVWDAGTGGTTGIDPRCGPGVAQFSVLFRSVIKARVPPVLQPDTCLATSTFVAMANARHTFNPFSEATTVVATD